MTDHVFSPGDRAYHVVRREIVNLDEAEDIRPAGHNLTDGVSFFKKNGTIEGSEDYSDALPILLPPWHPDVPERCREKKPKRKVEVVAWARVYPNGRIALERERRDALAYRPDSDEPMKPIHVELRGSYEVSE